MKYALSFLALLVGAIVTIKVTVPMVLADHQAYLHESACVREYIISGIPRSAISTGQGSCWVD